MVENLPQHYQSVNQIKKQRDCKNWNTHQWKRQISFKLLFFCFSFIKLVWDYNNFFCLIKDLQLCKSFITFHAPDSNLSLPFANSSYSDFDVFRPLYFSYFFYLFFFFFIINLTMEHPINFIMCIFAQKKNFVLYIQVQCSGSCQTNRTESHAPVTLHGINNSIEIFLPELTRALQIKLYNKL